MGTCDQWTRGDLGPAGKIPLGEPAPPFLLTVIMTVALWGYGGMGWTSGHSMFCLLSHYGDTIDKQELTPLMSPSPESPSLQLS